MATCYKCANTLPDLPSGPNLGRSETCPSCGRWVRCCKNCRHFHAPNDCREPQADWVRDREAANFCEFFALATSQSSSPDSSDEAKDGPQDAFDALFKKS